MPRKKKPAEKRPALPIVSDGQIEGLIEDVNERRELSAALEIIQTLGPKVAQDQAAMKQTRESALRIMQRHDIYSAMFGDHEVYRQVGVTPRLDRDMLLRAGVPLKTIEDCTVETVWESIRIGYPRRDRTPPREIKRPWEDE